jgi:dTDP-4-amino-4,6-dideoxygalactose transaminase
MFYLKAKDLEERTALLAHLKADDIHAVFHYVPLHSAPAGLRFSRFNGEDVFTTKESERLVRLPLWFGMNESMQASVISSLWRFYT